MHLQILPRCARFILRGDAPAIQHAGTAIGLTISGAPLTATQSGPRAALWLGPDEWLILAPEPEEDVVAEAITTALATTPHALVNVGHREIMAVASGPRTTDVLNAGCPLDLDIAAFPIGMCTRTVLAKSQILLWRTGAREFQLHVWRSFFPYVQEFLMEAASRL